MWKSAAVIAAASLCCSPSSARSEPGPILTYLMQQPVSAFSFGMYLLEQRVEKIPELDLVWLFDRRLSEWRMGLGYDWDRNRIHVSAYSIYDVNNAPNLEESKAACREAMRIIKLSAGVKDGEYLVPYMKRSDWSDYFFPTHYEITSTPKDAGASLDDIIEISIRIREVECKSDLMETEVSFVD